jgi:hypothetical protein
LNSFVLLALVGLLGVTAAGAAEDEPADSTSLSVTPPDYRLLSEGQFSNLPRYKGLRAVGLSLALPGSGQIYTRHWIKGAMYMGAELIGGIVLASDRIPNVRAWNAQTELYRLRSDSLLSSARRSFNGDSSVFGSYQKSVLDYDIKRYGRKSATYGLYQNIGWMTGIYLWSAMDALESSRQFSDDNPRNPALAGALSAIPGLALGQIYNGSFSKAGMIWMTQIMLGEMAYNYHQLMQRSLDESIRLQDPLRWESKYKNDYLPTWDANYDEAFRKRNMFLWYGVFFYLYNIFDAVVDAHLHDYNQRIRLEPIFDKKNESLGLHMSYTAPIKRGVF